jgi:hypothetical protein
VNLDGTADWGPELSFVDVWKRSRDFVPHEFTSYVWNTGTTLHVDAAGYLTKLLPNQKVRAVGVIIMSCRLVSHVVVCFAASGGINDDEGSERSRSVGNVHSVVRRRRDLDTVDDRCGIACASGVPRK